MPPPPPEQFAARLFAGPTLRTQPDRRLVKLVRDGYEIAFEEIVRRYRRPLDRFAASIVGGHSEDVTQDSFSKALQALRGSENEIELRPWLYRIVRNTALNDLRDRPPSAEQIPDGIAGAISAAAEAERRDDVARLIDRLRALPEPQRAAIVMRELEGLSHEDVAAALGVSGGAARQVIYRARAALREGFGLLVPLPLLRALVDGAGGEAAHGAAVASAASAAGGGAGLATKLGLATVVLAGTVGAGVAIHDNGRHDGAITAAAPSRSAAPRETRSASAAGEASTPRRPARAPSVAEGDLRRWPAGGSTGIGAAGQGGPTGRGGSRGADPGASGPGGSRSDQQPAEVGERHHGEPAPSSATGGSQSDGGAAANGDSQTGGGASGGDELLTGGGSSGELGREQQPVEESSGGSDGESSGGGTESATDSGAVDSAESTGEGFQTANGSSSNGPGS